MAAALTLKVAHKPSDNLSLLWCFVSLLLLHFSYMRSFLLRNAYSTLMSEQGNKYFLKGVNYYPDALGCYTLAIALKDLPDPETSILYSNRAQVYLLLGNHRRAFKDAEDAIKCCPTNVKAFYRAVKASMSLGLLEKAKSYCDMGLQVSPDHENLTDLAQQIDARILENARLKTEPASEIVRDWSELPIDVLMLTARRLHLADDYARFGSVCKPWREAFLMNDKKPSKLLPWVMLMEKEGTDLHSFYCPFDKKGKLFQLNLPEVRGRKCWGSSHGWLFTLDSKFQMHLVDPLSRVRILLPPLDKCPEQKGMFINGRFFRDGYVEKVLLLSDPLSSGSVILAVYANTKMAFTKAGDEAWRTVHCDTGDSSIVYDAMSFGGRFYVARSSGDVVICDSNGTQVKTVTMTPLAEAWEKKEAFVSYLVEIEGRIHVVVRRMVMSTWPYRKTGSFDVYILDTDTSKWEEVKTLGTWSVFVGNNYTFAVSETDYPECPGNSIYFTDHNYDFSGQYYHPQFTVPSSCDVGVYSLESKSLKRFLDMGFSLRCLYSLPVWIKPDLW
ncbi:hypothetical protein OROHE_011637 [Orobanche hederae]